VYFAHPRESLSYHYERVPTDPRVTHSVTLEVDPFGNVLKQASIAYGRRQPDLTLTTEDRDTQAAILVTYTEDDFTIGLDDANNYRTPLPCETRTYELTGLGSTPPGSPRFTFDGILAAGTGAAPLNFEEKPTPGVRQKRLIDQVRTYYRRNDLTAALPLGQLQSLALPFETYKLAFTRGLVTNIYGTRVSNSMLASDGQYVHTEGDTNWWVLSGRIFFSPGSGDTAAQELVFATAHFFLPHRFRDPFHTAAVPTETFVDYDDYQLLILETRDAVGNRITAGERDASGALVTNGIDYRVLQPHLVMDANRNRSAYSFDALGLVVGTALMGKPLPAAAEGDLLTAAFVPNLTDAEILDHLANPLAAPQSILQQATTRVVYDHFGYFRTKALAKPLPAAVYSLARETHNSDPVPTGGLKFRHGFSYSDGFGREIQGKVPAEPGPAPQRDANGDISIGPDGQPAMTAGAVTPRWIGSGWTVFNNKGTPIRKYEPFFTDTHKFEFDVRVGVSQVLFYDPVQRVVATLHPNHTWEKVVFNAWRQDTWDLSDTLLDDPAADPDVAGFFQRLPAAEYSPSWYDKRKGGALGTSEQTAALQAAIHANTPTIAHSDTLGRTFLTVAHNKFKYGDAPVGDPAVEEFYSARVHLDIKGNHREVIDPKGRITGRYDYDVLGSLIREVSMDAGTRLKLNDALGKPLFSWDSRDHAVRSEYDPLRRPLRVFVMGADPTRPTLEVLTERLVYGEQHPDSVARNLRGKLYLHLDQAGVITTERDDFKGNPLSVSRTLTNGTQYRSVVDWSAVHADQVALPTNVTVLLNLAALSATLAPLLEADTYTSSTAYDALNRPVTATAPHTPATPATVIRMGYNEANLLDRVEANLRGAVAGGHPVWTPFATNIDYDSKSQRKRIVYGNNASRFYEYDPLTFRLVHMITRRDAAAFPDDCPAPPPPGSPG